MEREIVADSWTPNHFKIPSDSSNICGFSHKCFDASYSKKHLDKIIEEV
jgi:hypothetical protein